jgi:hypothetical protein
MIERLIKNIAMAGGFCFSRVPRLADCAWMARGQEGKM